MACVVDYRLITYDLKKAHRRSIVLSCIIHKTKKLKKKKLIKFKKKKKKKCRKYCDIA